MELAFSLSCTNSSPFFRVSWLVWDRKTVMWEMKPKAREVSWPWSIQLNMELSPTGMIWRKFGIILSTMSFVLPLKSTQYCLQKLLWTLRPTERKWHRYSIGVSFACMISIHSIISFRLQLLFFGYFQGSVLFWHFLPSSLSGFSCISACFLLVSLHIKYFACQHGCALVSKIVHYLIIAFFCLF